MAAVGQIREGWGGEVLPAPSGGGGGGGGVQQYFVELYKLIRYISYGY